MTANDLKDWGPALLAKHPDNIVSSEFTTAKIFRPSYERNGCFHHTVRKIVLYGQYDENCYFGPREEPCMEQLMANEYQRMWLMERDLWLNKSGVSADKRRLNTKNQKTKEPIKAKRTRSIRTTSDTQEVPK